MENARAYISSGQSALDSLVDLLDGDDFYVGCEAGPLYPIAAKWADLTSQILVRKTLEKCWNDAGMAVE